MDTITIAALAGNAAEYGPTFLGEDLVGWRTALIAAIPAAIIYEIAMALTRRVTLRLPFLVLSMTRLGVPKKEWEHQYAEWRAELWFILRDSEKHWLARFGRGMAFAVPLAAGGARGAARAAADGVPIGALLRLTAKTIAYVHAVRYARQFMKTADILARTTNRAHPEIDVEYFDNFLGREE
ncbi:hypothetical protein ACWCPK_38265 [Streptomyces sp. NPDC001953]